MDAGYRISCPYAVSVEEEERKIGFNHEASLKKSAFILTLLADYLADKTEVSMFAAFCRDRTEDSFREGLWLGIFEKYAVYGSGFMAEDLWLSRIPYLRNKIFREAMEQIRENKANLLSLLGWEAGQVLVGNHNLDQKTEHFQYRFPNRRVWGNSETHCIEAPVSYATVGGSEQTGNNRLTAWWPAEDVQEERARLAENIKHLQQHASNSWLKAYACLDSKIRPR